MWNSSKSPPFWIIPTDPHPQKSVPPFGPKIPQNGKIPPFWPHWNRVTCFVLLFIRKRSLQRWIRSIVSNLIGFGKTYLASAIWLVESVVSVSVCMITWPYTKRWRKAVVYVSEDFAIKNESPQWFNFISTWILIA